MLYCKNTAEFSSTEQATTHQLSQGCGSQEYSYLVAAFGDPAKAAAKLPAGRLTCDNLNCSSFSESLNIYPALTQRCSLHTASNELTVSI